MMQKIKAALGQWMTGRHGADELSLMLLITGLVLSVLGSALRFGVLNLLGLAAYVFSMYRMLSRNVEKRYAENAKFLGLRQTVTTSVRQFFNRLKNARKYKYFKCPECRTLIRLPRKVGEVTVTCGKCHHAFKQKA
ncbi:MAG: hypothetical protein IKQ80_07270 [Clostridia bacterium]|nr:hypothetical protein [Clostridia bacterium]